MPTEIFSATFPSSTMKNVKPGSLVELGAQLGRRLVKCWIVKNGKLVSVTLEYKAKTPTQGTRDFVLEATCNIFGHGAINPKFRERQKK